MKKTTVRLADGRELSYYDERDDAVRDQPDRRLLEPTVTRSEIRYDQLLDQWVIIASHRQERTHLPAQDQCPLCPTRGDRLTEIPAPDYDVAVFENRFPALTRPAPARPPAADGIRPGIGRCEVVCFTSDHNSSFAALSDEQVATVLAAWTDRTAELSALPGVEQVFCFENRGQEVGVTLEHPHGQIYAYPFVTPRSARMLVSAAGYHRRTRRNLFEDVLASEQAEGSRVVASTPCWTAFVPRAARWPYEVHLYPNRRLPDLTALQDAERAEFATIYLDVLRRFDRLFDRPAPYISAWHQAPVREGREHFALHLELFTIRRTSGKIKFLAGSESGMDAFANDVAPEAAAARLRELA